MGKTLTSRVSDGLYEEIEQIAKIENLDKSSVVRRLLNKAIPEWKLEYALSLYQKGEISIGKAAELSSLSIWAILEKLAERKIPLNYDIKELENDFEKVKEL
jgi:predicted HTH domain antitoxin